MRTPGSKNMPPLNISPANSAELITSSKSRSCAKNKMELINAALSLPICEGACAGFKLFCRRFSDSELGIEEPNCSNADEGKSELLRQLACLSVLRLKLLETRSKSSPDFLTDINLIGETLPVDYEALPCLFCLKSAVRFTDVRHLEEHIRTKHAAITVVVCGLCHLVLDCEDSLLAHYKLHLKSGCKAPKLIDRQALIVCKGCGAQFAFTKKDATNVAKDYVDFALNHNRANIAFVRFRTTSILAPRCSLFVPHELLPAEEPEQITCVKRGSENDVEEIDIKNMMRVIKFLNQLPERMSEDIDEHIVSPANGKITTVFSRANCNLLKSVSTKLKNGFRRATKDWTGFSKVVFTMFSSDWHSADSIALMQAEQQSKTVFDYDLNQLIKANEEEIKEPEVMEVEATAEEERPVVKTAFTFRRRNMHRMPQVPVVIVEQPTDASGKARRNLRKPAISPNTPSTSHAGTDKTPPNDKKTATEKKGTPTSAKTSPKDKKSPAAEPKSCADAVEEQAPAAAAETPADESHAATVGEGGPKRHGKPTVAVGPSRAAHAAEAKIVSSDERPGSACSMVPEPAPRHSDGFCVEIIEGRALNLSELLARGRGRRTRSDLLLLDEEESEEEAPEDEEDEEEEDDDCQIIQVGPDQQPDQHLYDCMVCGVERRGRRALVAHMQAHEEQLHCCPICATRNVHTEMRDVLDFFDHLVADHFAFNPSGIRCPWCEVLCGGSSRDKRSVMLALSHILYQCQRPRQCILCACARDGAQRKMVETHRVHRAHQHKTVYNRFYCGRCMVGMANTIEFLGHRCESFSFRCQCDPLVEFADDLSLYEHMAQSPERRHAPVEAAAEPELRAMGGAEAERARPDIHPAKLDAFFDKYPFIRKPTPLPEPPCLERATATTTTTTASSSASTRSRRSPSVEVLFEKSTRADDEKPSPEPEEAEPKAADEVAPPADQEKRAAKKRRRSQKPGPPPDEPDLRRRKYSAGQLQRAMRMNQRSRDVCQLGVRACARRLDVGDADVVDAVEDLMATVCDKFTAVATSLPWDGKFLGRSRPKLRLRPPPGHVPIVQKEVPEAKPTPAPTGYHCFYQERYPCPPSFNNLASLQGHFTKEHGSLPRHPAPLDYDCWLCPVCMSVCTHRDDYEDHLRTHRQQQDLCWCPSCPLLCRSDREYDLHALAHVQKKIVFVCVEHELSFESAFVYFIHLETHGLKVLKFCKMCGYANSSVKCVLNHIERCTAKRFRFGEPYTRATMALGYCLASSCSIRKQPRSDFLADVSVKRTQFASVARCDHSFALFAQGGPHMTCQNCDCPISDLEWCKRFTKSAHEICGQMLRTVHSVCKDNGRPENMGNDIRLIPRDPAEMKAGFIVHALPKVADPPNTPRPHIALDNVRKNGDTERVWAAAASAQRAFKLAQQHQQQQKASSAANRKDPPRIRLVGPRPLFSPHVQRLLHQNPTSSRVYFNRTNPAQSPASSGGGSPQTPAARPAPHVMNNTGPASYPSSRGAPHHNYNNISPALLRQAGTGNWTTPTQIRQANLSATTVLRRSPSASRRQPHN